ncbi:PP2C family protein-serine/threonine phosphatase [Streptomyces sp. NRRL F-2580]|uniref:PP2C family protein-serine/threonine phosphatase n=1 Tax=Streptomyces sp. NRRL F-2580 TaxID=1463841 RepID=UPI00099C39CA|nr:PP2C family protein-serine/threonine phosphatase [Streptomyces sp. NRRL F-2580]
MITRGEMPQLRRVCVVAWGGVAVSWELATPGRLAPSLATCAAFLLLATGCALHIRRGLLGELRRSQEIAGAAQRALLRPMPGRIDGLTSAAAQLSASRGAAVGGDLYEAVPTAYGVRVVIGDVRGHGLPALGAAAAVLGAFREAAYDEATLGGVLRRMERALGRHVRDRARAEHPSACQAEPQSPAAEEFVTVLLLQIAPDDTLLALNCGHPWPYLIRPAPVTGVRALEGETLPPLGVVPLPVGAEPHPVGELRPGETLFLHTDGAEEARDAAGVFFPLRSVLVEAPAPRTPARLVAGVHAALLRHTGGRLADDVALLVLRNDRS